MDYINKITTKYIQGKLKETYMLKNCALNAQEQILELEEIARLLPKDKIKKNKVSKGNRNYTEANFESTVDRLVDLKECLSAEINNFVLKINENHNLINMISDVTISYILKERYFLNKPMKLIAASINRTPSSTYRLHDKGLEIIAREMRKREKQDI